MRETKNVPLELKADGTALGRWRQTFSTYNNVDDGGDRMIHGAFKRSIEERGLPPVLYSHQWGIPPIGQAQDAEEKRGKFEVLYQLFVRDGENHYFAGMTQAALAGGALKEGSIGYEAVKTKDVEEDGEKIRELHDVDLFEVSPTLVGLNRGTRGLLEAASALGVPQIGEPGWEEFAKMIAKNLWEFSQSKTHVSLSSNTSSNTSTTFLEAPKLDDAKSMDSEEPAAEPSPEEDEKLAARLAEVRRLRLLIPR